CQATVGALDQVEGEAGKTELYALVLELGAERAVEHEVHSAELVGIERPRVLQGPGRGEVEPLHENEHDVSAKDRRHSRVHDVFLQLLALLLVLLVEPDQGGHEDDEEHDDYPDAFAELHDYEDQNDT